VTVVHRAGQDWRIYCVSAGRPANVPVMSDLLDGWPLTWVVPQDEAADYQLAGAAAVLPVPRPRDGMPLGRQRNAALDDAEAHHAMCVQTDDDLRRLAVLGPDGKAAPAELGSYLDRWAAALAATPGARLAGCAPTPNPLFGGQRVRTRHWVMAQLFAAAPGPLRFDPATCPREDYDLTCQHLDTYGAVARCDNLLPTYQHWGNRGGCQTYRSGTQSAAVNELLLARWPQYLRPHARRPGELLFRTRRGTHAG
jgi:hypothetical protein